jgi:hypothetical protein
VDIAWVPALALFLGGQADLEKIERSGRPSGMQMGPLQGCCRCTTGVAASEGLRNRAYVAGNARDGRKSQEDEKNADDDIHARRPPRAAD